ncbi:hypothetical protein CB1_000341002 [Camelus ferus]|nr:hypothetical protein CB1_000341002 [Camelus ferus]
MYGATLARTGHEPLSQLGGRSHGGTISTLASLGHLVASSGVTDSALAFLLVTDIFLTLCIGLYLLLLQPESTRLVLESEVKGNSSEFSSEISNTV